MTAPSEISDLKKKFSYVSGAAEYPDDFRVSPIAPARKAKRKLASSGGISKKSNETKSTRQLKVKQYPDLPEVPDKIRPGLKLVICGFNPGIQSSVTGHRYAHVSNLFWRLLIESGMFEPELPSREDPCVVVKYKADIGKDDLLYVVKSLNSENAEQYLYENYDIGWTDLVSRPTRNIAELSSKEMDECVPALFAKISLSQTKIVCFIGKDIFKRIYKYANNGTLAKFDKSFEWGLQNQIPYFQVIEDWFDKNSNLKCPLFHVFPSTSGLVGSIPRELKLKLFCKLKQDYDKL